MVVFPCIQIGYDRKHSGFESDFVELDASRLVLSDGPSYLAANESGMSLADELAQVHHSKTTAHEEDIEGMCSKLGW